MIEFIREFALPENDFLKKVLSEPQNWERALTYNHGLVGVTDKRTNDRLSLDVGSDLDKMAFDLFGIGFSQYREAFPSCQCDTDEGYQVLRYESDQFYKRHVDDSRSKRRVLSGLIYLNDDYTGGELYFPLLDYTHKPKANTALFFPSNFVFEHEALPVISGTKYAVVTWFV